MDHAAEFRRCLIDLDVDGVRKLWKFVQPNLPQPASDNEALITMHMARTASPAVPDRLRVYSFRWLNERSLPNNLPDHLNALADRLYPVVAKAVGISVNSGSTLFKPIVPLVTSAMEYAVLETFADGHQDQPEVVSARMKEAKTKAVRKLVGI